MQITLLLPPTAGFHGFSGKAIDARGREFVFSLREDGSPFLVAGNSLTEPRFYSLCRMPPALARAVTAAVARALH